MVSRASSEGRVGVADMPGLYSPTRRFHRRKRRRFAPQFPARPADKLRGAQSMNPDEHPERARLLLAVRQHDPETASHMIRVAQYARLIANGLGLGASRAEQAASVCALHDVGKLGVPADVLNKRG